jgi:hypothetical protein
LGAKVFILFLLLSAGGLLKAADSDQPVPEECKRYATIGIPRDDAPNADEAKGLADCNSEALYYGFEQPPNPQRARKCAYMERDNQNAGSPFSGAALLTMVYANGNGAKRNVDLALRFACEAGGTPAEVQGRVAHLERLASEPRPNQNFDFCDDITSGYMEGFCADKQQKINQIAREKKLDSAIMHWTVAQRQQFSELQRVAEAFFEARSTYEIDQSGTNRAALSLTERGNLRNGFVSAILRFEAGNLPRFNATEMRRSEAHLEAVYNTALQSRGADAGTVTIDGIRKTQLFWADYRDAWTKFANEKYPHVGAGSFRTWLARQRAAELVKLESR